MLFLASSFRLSLFLSDPPYSTLWFSCRGSLWVIALWFRVLVYCGAASVIFFRRVSHGGEMFCLRSALGVVTCLYGVFGDFPRFFRFFMAFLWRGGLRDSLCS